jgi:hypothetical protein
VSCPPLAFAAGTSSKPCSPSPLSENNISLIFVLHPFQDPSLTNCASYTAGSLPPNQACPIPPCSNDKLWRPVAIELHGADEEKNVYTPADPYNLWLLAKGVFGSVDSGYHQLITHWLRTHACTEPYIISTHRNLSSLHPVSPGVYAACGMHLSSDRV